MAKDNELQVYFTLNNKAFKRGVKESKKELGNFGKAVGKLGLAIGAREMLNFGIEASRTAGKVRAVRLAFDKLNGVSLDQLRKATKGTISDLELMQRVNLAQKLGLDVSKLGDLFQFAARTAQETGQNIDFLVDSIVTGIGRKSPRILDNLGISAIALKKELGGVAAETATVAQITAAVGRIAKKSMGETTGIVDTTEVSVNQLRASWQNFIASFGEKSAPAFNTVVTWLSKVIDKVNELYTSTGQKAAQSAKTFVADIAGQFSAGKIDRSGIDKLLSDLKSEMNTIEARPVDHFDSSTSSGRAANADARARRDNDLAPLFQKYQALQALLKDLNKESTKTTSITEDQQKAFDKYHKQLALVNADIELFGENNANLGAKVSITRDAMAQLVAEGISPQTESLKKLRTELQGYESDLRNLRAGQSQIKAPMEKFRNTKTVSANSAEAWVTNQRLKNQLANGEVAQKIGKGLSEAQERTIAWRNTLETVGITWQNVGAQMGSVFGQMISSGNVAFGNILRMLGRLIAKFILAVAAAAALRSLTGDVGAGGRAVGTATGVAAGLTGLIGGLIPMAEGGILTGPTPVLAGEAGTEAIVPINKFPDIFGKTLEKAGGGMSQGGFVAQTRLSGQDLLIMIQRAQGFQDRRGG